MTNHFSMLNSFIKRHVEMSEAELTTFNQKCEIVEFSKGELIMKAGETQQNLYFINKGLVRNYIQTAAAWCQLFYNGYQVNYDKRTLIYVRAIRSF